MKFFDFHHHHSKNNFGIYNLEFEEAPTNGWFSAGIHPAIISQDFETQFSWLKEISQNENCIAIGECGLDGLIKVDEKLQEEVFLKQIEWANEIQKPLIIHCVRRFPQLISLCKKAIVPLIVHGFNKKKSIGEELLKNQFYLSFGKSLLENVNLQNFLEEISLDKIFLETDDANFEIESLYQKVSEIKNISDENLIKTIHKNLKIFKKIR